jgi:ketosteroid isomerase-like protein
MTSTDVVLAFVDAINSGEIERICELMTFDHLFVDSGGAGYRGRETMREGWIRYLSMVPDYKIDMQDSLSDRQTVIVVGIAHGTYSPDGNLAPADRWSTPAAWRAVVATEQIAVWQVYADNEPLRQIMRRYRKETA